MQLAVTVTDTPHIHHHLQIQEWFKNRRKKDKLISERQQGKRLPKGHRGRRSTSNGSGGSQGITADEGSVIGQDSLLGKKGRA